jgi:hypothetical protein
MFTHGDVDACHFALLSAVASICSNVYNKNDVGARYVTRLPHLIVCTRTRLTWVGILHTFVHCAEQQNIGEGDYCALKYSASLARVEGGT